MNLNKEANKYYSSQLHYNKWLRVLEEHESLCIIEMLKEFAEDWHKLNNEQNPEPSVATVDAQSDEDWKQEFTYFLEHSITHDPEKIKMIVAEVERIAGSKKEELTYKQGNTAETFRKLREIGSGWDNVICVCRGLMRDNACSLNCKEFHNESLSNEIF